MQRGAETYARHRELAVSPKLYISHSRPGILRLVLAFPWWLQNEFRLDRHVLFKTEQALVGQNQVPSFRFDSGSSYREENSTCAPPGTFASFYG